MEIILLSNKRTIQGLFLAGFNTLLYKMLLFFITVILAFSCDKGSSGIEIKDIPDTKVTNINYIPTRAPLVTAPLIQLPLGSIQPSGWLKTQVDLMTEGYTGRLNEISIFLAENNGWFGGDERGWEEPPYWLRGFYDLSVLTENKRVDSLAHHWIEVVIASLDKEGYYGAKINRLIISDDGRDSIIDLWPHMVMNDALISHYEATEDERVIPMMSGFFRFCYDLPANLFITGQSWTFDNDWEENMNDWKVAIQTQRAGDFIPQIYWLYDQTGEKWLLELALRVYHKTQPPVSQWLDHHVVNIMQRFRYPAQMYRLTGDEYYLSQTQFFYDQTVQTWGNMPRGGLAVDEVMRNGKIDPRQAIESCAIVEGNKSFYILGNMTGQVEFADKIEDLTFNWLPATHTPDLKGLRYLTAANMVCSVYGMDYQRNGPFPLFGASMHRCCQHNTAMGWPWFVKNMWKASNDNGLVAFLYGPNEVQARVGKKGTGITIKTSTSYPFSDELSFHVQMEESASFPLYLRIPGWADDLEIYVNGDRNNIQNENGRYVKIEREWNDQDEVILRFNPAVKLTEWPRNKSLSVDRGPLTYSLHIKEEWNKIRTDKFGWDVWEILPVSDWNYGIDTDDLDPEKDIRVKISETIPDQPWDEKTVPISLSIPVRKINGWKATVQNTIDPLREGPVRSDEELEWVEMIPMGAAHLRLTCMPAVSTRMDARYWDEIPDPSLFMRGRLAE